MVARNVFELEIDDKNFFCRLSKARQKYFNTLFITSKLDVLYIKKYMYANLLLRPEYVIYAMSNFTPNKNLNI